MTICWALLVLGALLLLAGFAALLAAVVLSGQISATGRRRRGA